MPGYQQIRFMPNPTEFYHNEPIYGHLKKDKKKRDKFQQKQPHQHPLFEDLKAKHYRERKEYERMIAAKENRSGNFNPYKYDSLKLIGSCNDVSYLDNFMSMPRQRTSQSQQELYQRGKQSKGGLTKSSSTVFNKGQKEHRNSVVSDSAVTAAMMANIRSANSDDNIYESVEMIHYKKTLQNMNRIKKTRSLQKTGHPLFDHLREEQALKGPTRSKTSSSRREELNSDGHSPSQSSSSSGDEYETYPKMRFQSQQNRQPQQHTLKKEKNKQKPARRTESSESEEDWRMIPRPKFLGGKSHPTRRISTETDESDDSTILR